MAHRVAYEIARGPIPEGMLVRHSCDNPTCCNPDHLLIGTHKENTGDAIERNRLAAGERHGKTRLTQEIVDYIRANPLGLAQCDLATLYGVSEASISRIRKGNRWTTTKRGKYVDTKEEAKEVAAENIDNTGRWALSSAVEHYLDMVKDK